MGERLRVTAQLIDVRSGFPLWSERYDRTLDDVFAIQDEISQALVEKLRVKLLGAEETASVKRYTEDVEAYELYLRGRFEWYLRTEQGLRIFASHVSN